jgi:hypothetical protein
LSFLVARYHAEKLPKMASTAKRIRLVFFML